MFKSYFVRINSFISIHFVTFHNAQLMFLILIDQNSRSCINIRQISTNKISDIAMNVRAVTGKSEMNSSGLLPM